MSNTNAQTAHLWANQVKPKGKSGNGNLWFEGRTLYSYRTPIGHFISPDLVAVSTHAYSTITTGKHYTARWRALHNNPRIKVIRVSELPRGLRWGAMSADQEREAILTFWRDEWQRNAPGVQAPLPHHITAPGDRFARQVFTVRVRGDHVETSGGAKVPLATGRLFVLAAKQFQRTGENPDFTRGQAVGGFRFERFFALDNDIFAIVGCHVLSLKDAEAAFAYAG